MKNLKQKLKKLSGNRGIRRGAYSWLVMILAQVVILIIKWHQLPPVVPLFYSHPWGEKQLASPIYLIIFPGSSLVFSLVNGFLATLAFPKKILIASVLLANSLFLTLISTIGLIKIIYLVT